MCSAPEVLAPARSAAERVRDEKDQSLKITFDLISKELRPLPGASSSQPEATLVFRFHPSFVNPLSSAHPPVLRNDRSTFELLFEGGSPAVTSDPSHLRRLQPVSRTLRDKDPEPPIRFYPKKRQKQI